MQSHDMYFMTPQLVCAVTRQWWFFLPQARRHKNLETKGRGGIRALLGKCSTIYCSSFQ